MLEKIVVVKIENILAATKSQPVKEAPPVPLSVKVRKSV
jgi:hypothetical protein